MKAPEHVCTMVHCSRLSCVTVIGCIVIAFPWLNRCVTGRRSCPKSGSRITSDSQLIFTIIDLPLPTLPSLCFDQSKATMICQVLFVSLPGVRFTAPAWLVRKILQISIHA